MPFLRNSALLRALAINITLLAELVSLSQQNLAFVLCCFNQSQQTRIHADRLEMSSGAVKKSKDSTTGRLLFFNSPPSKLMIRSNQRTEIKIIMRLLSFRRGDGRRDLRFRRSLETLPLRSKRAGSFGIGRNRRHQLCRRRRFAARRELKRRDKITPARKKPLSSQGEAGFFVKLAL
jgi:hypothetical protein